MKIIVFLLLIFAFPVCFTSCSKDTSVKSDSTQSSGNINQESNTESTDDCSGKKIELVINSTVLTAELEDNKSADEFAQLLENGALTVSMEDYGSFEKTAQLPKELVRSDSRITAQPGDIILYQGKTITVYYDFNTYTFTRLGKIINITSEDLKKLLGNGNVTITFRLPDT